jgi:hypothetical protein
MPSASNLFLSRFKARSTGSPLRTITSGIESLPLVYKTTLLTSEVEPTRASEPRQLLSIIPPGALGQDISATNDAPENANYFKKDVSKHGFSLFSVRATGGSVLLIVRTLQHTGLLYASPVLVNVVAPSFPGTHLPNGLVTVRTELALPARL